MSRFPDIGLGPRLLAGLAELPDVLRQLLVAVETMSSEVTRMRGSVETLGAQVDELRDHFAAVRTDVHAMGNEVAPMRASVDLLHGEIVELGGGFQALQSTLTRLPFLRRGRADKPG